MFSCRLSACVPWRSWFIAADRPRQATRLGEGERSDRSHHSRLDRRNVPGGDRLHNWRCQLDTRVDAVGYMGGGVGRGNG